MKKKLLILTIIFGLIITIMPRTVYAANNRTLNQKALTEKHKFKYKKPTKAQIKAVGSTDEYYRQLVLETIDEMYFSSLEIKYAPHIKVLIDQKYESLSDEINSYENMSDHLIIFSFLGMEFAAMDAELTQKLYSLDTLVQLDISKVDEDTDYEDFKDRVLEYIDEAFGCYEEESYKYNDYYYSIITGDKEEAKSTLSDPSDWLEMADELGKARASLEYYSVFEDFSYSLDLNVYCPYDEDEDYEDDWDDYYDNTEEIKEALGVTEIPEFYVGQNVYTNEEIAVIKEALKTYIDVYVNRQLVDNDEISSLAEEVINQIDDNDNVDEIVSLYENNMEKFQKISGVEYKVYTEAKYKRNVKKLKEFSDIYLDSKKYYEYGGMLTNENILNIASELIYYYSRLYEAEIPSDFMDRVKALLDETPTYAQELKTTKANLVKDLKTYLNNKKYNQTKVKSIVNAGVKAINSETDIDEVYNVYAEYVEKAEKTVYKFKITTSKVGKGTITKSATVKYGNSYTVKIKPNVGYKISAIYVDGKKVKLTEKYTFKKVTKKHTIKVIFK